MDEQENKEVVIRYLDVEDQVMRDSLIAEAFDPGWDGVKLAALKRLNIEPAKGERPLAAWLRTMHVENGLEYQQPAHPAIADAVLGSRASRFTWFLA